MKKNNVFPRIPGLCALFFLLIWNRIAISQVDVKMRSIVKQLRSSAIKNNIDVGHMTLAVFPFQTDAALMKKRVHIACGELLTLNILEDGFFRIVERTELQKILDEQKLGLTGAVETETAARVGHMLGARLAALGNVMRLGKSYQVVVKLVDTQTSEIISAAFEEMPVRTFDEEAERYLVLVPEHQTIGLYFQVDFTPFLQINILSPSTFREILLAPRNPSSSLFPPTTAGIGFKYVPWPRWMLDLFVAFHVDFGREGEDLLNVSPSEGNVNTATEPAFEAMITGRGGRISFNRIIPVRPGIFGYAGVGLDVYELMYNEERNRSFVVDNIQFDIKVTDSRKTFIFMFARFGIEWRIQDRFGLALFNRFYLWQDTAAVQAELIRDPARESEKHRINIYEFKTPIFMFGLTGSFYF